MIPEVIALMAEWALQKLGLEVWDWIHQSKSCAQAKREAKETKVTPSGDDGGP